MTTEQKIYIPYATMRFTEAMESEGKSILSFRAAQPTIDPLDALVFDEEWTDRMILRLSNSPPNYVTKHVALPKKERGVSLGLEAVTLEYKDFREVVERYCHVRNLPLPAALDACAMADVFITVDISRYTLCYDDNPGNQRLDPPLF